MLNQELFNKICVDACTLEKLKSSALPHLTQPIIAPFLIYSRTYLSY